MAFKVVSPEILEQLESDLRACGVPTERVPEREFLHMGEHVRFEIPSGFLIDLYAEKSKASTPQTLLNPPPWNPETECGSAPTCFDHALLYRPDVEKVQKLFVEVLGFYLTEQVMLKDNPTQLAIFLFCIPNATKIPPLRSWLHTEPRGNMRMRSEAEMSRYRPLQERFRMHADPCGRLWT